MKKKFGDKTKVGKMRRKKYVQ